MSGIARSAEGPAVCEKIHRVGKNPGTVTVFLAKIALALTVATAQTALSPGLESPDSGVVCNHNHAICYDRYGASVGLTEAFLDRIIAERLTASLHRSGTYNRAGTTFSPADGVESVRGTEPCRPQRQPHAVLTALLYGLTSRPIGQIAEIRAIKYMDLIATSILSQSWRIPTPNAMD